MKEIIIEASLFYDSKSIHGDDKESIDWFYKNILMQEDLILHSNEIGDQIGTIKITKVKGKL